MEEIVAGARVSRTSFYALYANKGECLLAVFERGMEAMGAALAQVVSQPLAPAERIREQVRTVARTFAADPDVGRVMLIESVGATAEVEQARVRARLAMAALIETQLDDYEVWRRKSEPARQYMSMSAMAAVVEPLSHLAATGRLAEWEQIVDPVAEFIAVGLIRAG